MDFYRFLCYHTFIPTKKGAVLFGCNSHCPAHRMAGRSGALRRGGGRHREPGLHLVCRRALIAFLVSLFTNSLLTQCIVFLAVSALCLALVRPVARKHFSPRLRPTNADRLLGAVAVVTQEIDNRSATGQVKVSGQIWTARSQGEDPIPVGTSVTVLRIEGVKLIVQAKAPVPV